MAANRRTELGRVRAWLPRTNSPLAYLVGASLILFGVLLRFPLDMAARQPLPPYITLYPMIVLASFVGGVRVGAASAIASGLAAWMLWISPERTWPPSPIQAATSLVYLGTAALTVFISGMARALLDDVAASEEQRTRETRESVHRIKNLLAVIQSISSKISRDAKTIDEYRDRLRARLDSLATAQDLLLKRDWSAVTLKDIVQSALGAFLPNPRLETRPGPDVVVPSAAVTPISMALYELATNSMKYGALASPDGFVRLEWSIREGRCALEWREVGLAHLALGETGAGGGFGSTLIRSALSGVEDGSVRYDVRPQTVSCVFEWPVESGA